MRHDALHQKLAQILKPIADLKGEVFYSAVDCLKRGVTYLLGHNPGHYPSSRAQGNLWGSPRST